jgi:cell division protein FtsL
MATMAISGGAIEPRMHSRRTSERAMSMSERNQELYEQQRMRRRGPTPEMFFSKHIDNSRIVTADDPERRREMRTFTIVTMVFFMLTMIYVYQHFSAIEVGYRVEIQKQQVEQMGETNRQLRLSEAQLSDPGRIDTIAKQLGLEQPLPGQVIREDSSADAAGTVVAQARIPAAPFAN